jgi:hypothetical protein
MQERYLADLRALVRKEIEFKSGIINRQKVQSIATAAFVCDQTVINFASGHTRKPSSWTKEHIAEAIGLRVAFVPINTPKLPGEVGYISKTRRPK